MELTGEKVINAPQARVYDALHDPVILRQALPGVQSFTKQDDGRYAITAALKVGPLRPTFTGIVEVYNEDRPAGYSLRGEANGGMAGTVGGNAHVALAAVDAETTNLAYHVTADCSGQIATLEGIRLDVTARTLVAEFFARLQSILDGEQPEAEDDIADDDRAAAAASDTGAGQTVVAGLRTPYQPPRYPPHSNYPAMDEMGEPVALQNTSTAVTDATGAPAYEVQPLAASSDIAGNLPQTPYRSAPRGGFEGGAATTTVYDGGGGGVGRWLMVAVGVVAIALLLNGGFAGMMS